MKRRPRPHEGRWFEEQTPHEHEYMNIHEPFSTMGLDGAQGFSALVTIVPVPVVFAFQSCSNSN